MRILGINTAVPQTEIALLDGEKVIYKDTWVSNYNEAETLLPALEKVLKTNGVKKLDRIFVVQGPGSFTGLRVGVTVANTLAYVLNVPIISCTTFEYLQHKIPANMLEKTAIILRAGGQKVAVWLQEEAEINTVNKDEILNHLATSEFIASDIRDENRASYKIPPNTKWLDHNEMKEFTEVLKEITDTNPPVQKIVKPLYLAPPSITKSKKEVYT